MLFVHTWLNKLIVIQKAFVLIVLWTLCFTLSLHSHFHIFPLFRRTCEPYKCCSLIYFTSAEQQHSGNYSLDYFSVKIGSRSYSVVESIFVLAFRVRLAVALLIWHCPSGLEDNFFPQSSVYLLKCTTKHLKKVISAPSNRAVQCFVVCAHCVISLDYKILNLGGSPRKSECCRNKLNPLSPSVSLPHASQIEIPRKYFFPVTKLPENRSAPVVVFYQ